MKLLYNYYYTTADIPTNIISHKHKVGSIDVVGEEKWAGVKQREEDNREHSLRLNFEIKNNKF